MRFWEAFGLMQIAEVPVSIAAKYYGNPPIFGEIGNMVFWLIFSAFCAFCASENVKGECK